MELLMDVAILFSAINSVLLIVTLVIYARLAIRSGAAHSVGLVIFSLFLLGNSLLTVFSYTTMSPFFGSQAVPYLSAMSVLEFVGLVVLLKITL